MKKIERYECEFCGKIYNNSEDAIEHEEKCAIDLLVAKMSHIQTNYENENAYDCDYREKIKKLFERLNSYLIKHEYEYDDDYGHH